VRDREAADNTQTSLVDERSKFPLELTIPVADPSPHVLVELTRARIMFSDFPAAGQVAKGKGDQRPGDDRGEKWPRKVMAEIHKSIGERHSSKLAAGEVAVGPIIGPLANPRPERSRTEPNATEPPNDEIPLWSGISGSG
jgi:hypothetical protein